MCFVFLCCGFILFFIKRVGMAKVLHYWKSTGMCNLVHSIQFTHSNISTLRWSGNSVTDPISLVTTIKSYRFVSRCFQK